MDVLALQQVLNQFWCWQPVDIESWSVFFLVGCVIWFGNGSCVGMALTEVL
jgi:hypothetical protein